MKRFIRLISVLLLLSMLALSFASCGVIKGDTVMEYEGYKITEAMYSYWASRYKTQLVYGSSEKIEWDAQLPDGTTYESYLEEQIITPWAKKVLVCMKLFDDYELKIDDDTATAIKEQIDGLISIYGSKKELNTYLAEFNLNVKTLEMIYYAEAKVDIVFDHIFGQNGLFAVTSAEKDEYLKANYYCVNWIYIYTDKKPVSAEEGTNADGSFIMEELSPEEKAEKKQLVSDIIAKLESKEKTFAEMKKEYCEDKNKDGSSKYDYLPNGFNLCANDYASYGIDLIRLIQGMQVGEIKTYSDTYGGTYIIVRNPLSAYSELTVNEINVMKDFDSYVTDNKWDKIVAELKITVDTEVAERYDVKKVNLFAYTAI